MPLDVPLLVAHDPLEPFDLVLLHGPVELLLLVANACQSLFFGRVLFFLATHLLLSRALRPLLPNSGL